MRFLIPQNDWNWSRRRMSPEKFGDVFEEFDRMFDRFLQPRTAEAESFQMGYNFEEGKDHYMLSFDMPGVKKEDIKVEMNGNVLRIAGERRSAGTEKFYGKYERSFTLPSTINSEKIEARYEDGVLNVVIPKAEEAKVRNIEIQ